jgi:hypothetical protein
LKLLLFVSLFCFFSYLIIFPFTLTSLLSIPTHPSILNIASAIIISQKILNCTQYKDNNNIKGNIGKTEKTGKLVSPQQKISIGTQREEQPLAHSWPGAPMPSPFGLQ